MSKGGFYNTKKKQKKNNQNSSRERHNQISQLSSGSKKKNNKVIINEPRHDKTNKVTVRPAKTRISLGIRPILSVFAVRSVGS